MKSESHLCTNFVLIFLTSLNIGITGNSQCPPGMLAFDRLVKLYTHFCNSFYLVPMSYKTYLSRCVSGEKTRCSSSFCYKNTGIPIGSSFSMKNVDVDILGKVKKSSAKHSVPFENYYVKGSYLSVCTLQPT